MPKPYTIRIPRARVQNEEIDIVEALRERAAHHVASHLSKEPRREPDDDEYRSYKGENYDTRPLHLWSAKLCLEVAKLFKETEPGDP